MEAALKASPAPEEPKTEAKADVEAAEPVKAAAFVKPDVKLAEEEGE